LPAAAVPVAYLPPFLSPAADGVVELTLTKAEGMHWWSAVLAGGPAIDVQAVEPESSKLTDLDPETRQTVEKMMVRGRGGGRWGSSIWQCGLAGGGLRLGAAAVTAAGEQ
jgi:hypothetical protein